MKGKTRRKIKRFWRIQFPTCGVVISIGYLIVSILIKPLIETSAAFSKLQMHVPGWYLLMCFRIIVIVILYIIGESLSHIYSKALAPEINDFEEINFGKPGENTILNVINGLLNAEKVEPFYVHAAPKSKEVETVYLRLKETGFAMISGGPGEGKSMVTYHSAYKFKEEERYYIYKLRVELLEDKTVKEINDELLFQLDDLKGKRKLIIVDDAHKSVSKNYINRIMQKEANEGNCKYIWVETEFYEEKQVEIQSNMCVRVDFQEFFENLLKNFYQSQDPFFQEALKGCIEGLDDAINRVNKGKIHDVWWFAFVASQGEKRLAQEIDCLTDLQMLVLFLISAYTVLSGEAELPRNYLLNKLENLKWGWLTNDLRSSSFSDVIRFLQEQTQIRKSMIRVYDKSERERGYIASLHYNFARTVIRASLFRADLIEDLLSSVEELLTSEYHKCAYIGAFHDEIGVYAAGFDRKNKDWLISFVNNILPEKLQCYPRILKGIKSVAIEIYNEIIRKVNIDGIAEKVNSTEASLFHKLAHLLKAMGGRRGELIKKLDLKQLSGTVNSAEIVEFAHLAYLLDAMGKRQDELIGKFDLKQLSGTANSAKIVEFGYLAYLLNAMGKRRNELIGKLDLKQLSKAANNAEIGQFEQLSHLLNAIGKHRDALIEKLDLMQLGAQANNAKIEQFAQVANLILALGDNRSRLIEKINLKNLAQAADSAEVEQFKNLAQLLRALGSRQDELSSELDLGKLANAANAAEIGEFEQVAELLKCLGQRKSQLSILLNHDTLVQRANQAGPYDITGLTMLVAELEEEDRNKFILEVDWNSICLKCPIYVYLLSPLGASLENLWRRTNISPDKASIKKVTQHLWAHASEIKHEISKANPRVYSGVAKLLWNCNQVAPALAKQIATETMSELAETFRISPTVYQGTSRLINAYHAIDPDLSISFVKNNRVLRRIQQSINRHDWSKEIEGLKHLIKAFYRSAPDLWRKMVNSSWIFVDLNSLDLNSIYREVDEEKNVGTAHNAT
ncbi:hypothetical protein KJ830_10870 [bacterium]|nr:hypothetical protein [bacterium]MBU4511531.1 hypothetical protein [bacterium]